MLDEDTSVFNENKNKIEPTWASVVGMGLLLIGFCFGWFIKPAPDNFYIFIFCSAFIGWIIKKFRDFHVIREEIYFKRLTQARQEERYLLKERQRERKYEKEPYSFTSEDFMPDAQNLLLDIIRESKKKKIKVNGSYMIQRFMKLIR